MTTTQGRARVAGAQHRTQGDWLTQLIGIVLGLLTGAIRWKSLRRLIDISRTSRRAEDREALAELIRDAVDAGVIDAIDLVAAIDDETRAQGAFDVAERSFEHNPNPATLARLTECGLRQIATTRMVLAAAPKKVMVA